MIYLGWFIIEEPGMRHEQQPKASSRISTDGQGPQTRFLCADSQRQKRIGQQMSQLRHSIARWHDWSCYFVSLLNGSLWVISTILKIERKFALSEWIRQVRLSRIEYFCQKWRERRDSDFRMKIGLRKDIFYEVRGTLNMFISRVRGFWKTGVIWEWTEEKCLER